MFGRRKDKDQAEGGKHWTDKAAGKLAGAGIRLQTKFADRMNKCVSGLQPPQLKFILALFCLLSGGFSIYIAAHALLGNDKKQPVFMIQPLEMPRHYDRTGGEINENGNYVDESLYREIQGYKRYMDSTGEAIRPGLADSIKLLEQIYHSQQQ